MKTVVANNSESCFTLIKVLSGRGPAEFELLRGGVHVDVEIEDAGRRERVETVFRAGISATGRGSAEVGDGVDAEGVALDDPAESAEFLVADDHSGGFVVATGPTSCRFCVEKKIPKLVRVQFPDL